MARHHDIINGYTFTLHDQYNNLVMLSLFSDNECEVNIEEVIQENKNTFHMLPMLTHEKTTYLYQQLYMKSEVEKMTSKKYFQIVRMKLFIGLA